MSAQVTVIGLSDAGPESLPEAALALVRSAQVLAGGERHLAFFPDLRAERIRIANDVPASVQAIDLASQSGHSVVVLASGDPFLFGIGPALVRQLGIDRLRVIPGVSSVQVAFARVGEAWQDATVLSAHGRPVADLIPQAMAAHKLAILTDGQATPGTIAEALLGAGVNDCRAVVCERLGGASERIIETRLSKLAEHAFDPLNVLLIFREPRDVSFAFGRPEVEFHNARGQITKAEVRAVTLSKLGLRTSGILWDIGGGSGALAIEAARLMMRGQVFTIERDEEQRQLIEANVRRHGATNVRIVAGEAPEALAGLPSPDSVFLGGSGGRLMDLAELLPRPFVANVAIVEHLSLLLRRFPQAEVTQMAIARSSDIGDGHRLAAMNPVFIVSVPADEQA